ncbi:MULTISPECIES: GNAT family N-acetyltransferase [unclassified Methylobacterium]|uniref:GNAT family N-acetyltransferase n=1 Tax=unclassified Methylobacterium TaxID=2615210 RepID=UPI0011C1E604|nr:MULTISPECIES: GNAT family N-acetyltransferase [unclassified Methylobacterium]QEE41044.1 GNAT family N-acetyltransferase [Methylobacterium sp. WL1]TXN58891.1 GNAT family N-acetyltransferase [Methylobacterium sp. WL2]
MGNRYGLEIRAAAGSDAPGLAELLGAAGVAVGAADLTVRLDALQGGGGTALVAVEWGPPSGLIALSPVRTLEAPRATGLITTLIVGAESRRRGIGRVLLKAAGRAARQAGCDRLVLSVGPGQDDLRAFCEAAGFAADGHSLARPLLKRGSGET